MVYRLSFELALVWVSIFHADFTKESYMFSLNFPAVLMPKEIPRRTPRGTTVSDGVERRIAGKPQQKIMVDSQPEFLEECKD